jgi:hypothetical protein
MVSKLMVTFWPCGNNWSNENGSGVQRNAIKETLPQSPVAFSWGVEGAVTSHL